MNGVNLKNLSKLFIYGKLLIKNYYEFVSNCIKKYKSRSRKTGFRVERAGSWPDFLRLILLIRWKIKMKSKKKSRNEKVFLVYPFILVNLSEFVCRNWSWHCQSDVVFYFSFSKVTLECHSTFTQVFWVVNSGTCHISLLFCLIFAPTSYNWLL